MIDNTLDYGNIDPRALLRTHSVLWVSSSKHPKAPLMSGSVLIPARLIDFVHHKCRWQFYYGEKCYKFDTAYWETWDRDKYKPGKKIPEYTGIITVNPSTMFDEADRKAYLDLAKNKNFKLDKDNYIPRF